MEINRNYTNNTGTTRPSGRLTERAVPDSTRLTGLDGPVIKDRRRRPDRRQRQLAIKGPDRRKRKDRRQPKLLHPRTGRPDDLEDRRGAHVDASV